MAYVCTYIKANPTQHLEEEKNFVKKKEKNQKTKEYKDASSLYVTYRL